MYTDAEFLFPDFQEFSEEVQQLLHDELYYPSPMTESSFFSEYDLGVQGDLLRAPEPILEEQISIADQNVMPTQNQEAESLQQDELFTKVLHECNEDNSVVSSFETNQINEITRFPTEEMHSIQHSVSSEPLNSSMRPSFLDFSDYGMSRAFSEGDIKTLSCSYEDRQQKLTRYRMKKLKRNFGRRVKNIIKLTTKDYGLNLSTRAERCLRTASQGLEEDLQGTQVTALTSKTVYKVVKAHLPAELEGKQLRVLMEIRPDISERRQLHPLKSKKHAVLVLSTYSHGDNKLKVSNTTLT
ncbi:hypothetical protein V2J09_002103 [Rumex salicifolius]